MNQALIVPQPGNKPELQVYYARVIGTWSEQFNASGKAAVSNLMGAMAAKHVVGVASLLLKDQCNHGEFMALRAQHFAGLSERTDREWRARSEKDMAASVALREATNKLLNAPGDEAALRAFADVANTYFRDKTTLLKQGAGEIGLLGWRKPSAPTGQRAKLPRGKDADIARREFETKSKLCFSTLTRELEKAATLRLGDAHCWDVGTTDAELEALDRTLVLLRAGIKASLENRKALVRKQR